MDNKKKPVSPKEPEHWTIPVNRELREPFKKMAKRHGMTVSGAASVALRKWLIMQQYEIRIAGDGKEKEDEI